MSIDKEKCCSPVCLNCDGKSFTAQYLDIEKYNLKSIAWVCDNCDVALMDSDQMNNLLSKVNSS